MQPYFLIRRIASVAWVPIALAALSVAQDAGVSSIKKPYVPTGNEAVLMGIVTFTGEQPKSRLIDMSADPVCVESNENPKTEDVIINDRTLANVFIYLKGEHLAAYTFEQSTSPAVLAHKSCQYTPRALGIRVGQSLNVLNSDSTIHNTHPTPRNNKEWNQSHSPGAVLIKTFDKPEVFIPFKDNQHPWEKAYLGVFDHPFFAVSDDNGNYKIEGVPPGRYTVVAWHERFGEKTMDIVFVPGESRYQSFNFDEKDTRSFK